MTEPFSSRMRGAVRGIRINKLRRAREVFERIMPVLEDTLPERRDANVEFERIWRDLEVLKNFFKNDSQIIEVGLSQMKEIADAVTTAEYDLAHVETFLNAAEEYLIDHPDTIKAVMNMMNMKLVEDAYVSMDAERLQAYEDAIKAAKQRREALE